LAQITHLRLARRVVDLVYIKVVGINSRRSGCRLTGERLTLHWKLWAAAGLSQRRDRE
jgi:hypothetical protein